MNPDTQQLTNNVASEVMHRLSLLFEDDDNLTDKELAELWMRNQKRQSILNLADALLKVDAMEKQLGESLANKNKSKEEEEKQMQMTKDIIILKNRVDAHQRRFESIKKAQKENMLDKILSEKNYEEKKVSEKAPEKKEEKK